MLKIDRISEIKVENLNPIIQVLIKRDNMKLVDAINYFCDAVEEWDETCDNISYDEACDFIEDRFGLEPDYLMDFLTDTMFD